MRRKGERGKGVEVRERERERDEWLTISLFSFRLQWEIASQSTSLA